MGKAAGSLEKKEQTSILYVLRCLFDNFIVSLRKQWDIQKSFGKRSKLRIQILELSAYRS